MSGLTIRDIKPGELTGSKLPKNCKLLDNTDGGYSKVFFTLSLPLSLATKRERGGVAICEISGKAAPKPTSVSNSTNRIGKKPVRSMAKNRNQKREKYIFVTHMLVSIF